MRPQIGSWENAQNTVSGTMASTQDLNAYQRAMRAAKPTACHMFAIVT
jgi:hypothetical protein